jgi:hypothetical protein
MTKETAQHYRALAAKYRTFGFNLVPLGADKRPVVTGINLSGGLSHFRWQDWQATPQTDQRWKELKAFAWWTDVAGLAALSGPVSGDLVCIDFDRAEWATVETFLTAANLSAAWTVTTPGGGWHVWVRCPGLELDKGKLDRAAVDGAGHIELRHTGHYTALPGSMHPNGGCYAWHGDEPTEAPPSVAPDVLLAAYDAVTVVTAPVVSVPISGDMPTGTANIAPAYAQKALDEEVARLRTAADGTRNDTANKTAFALGQLVGAGALAEGEVEAALLSAATSAGLAEGEALASIRSGLRAGVKLPRQIPTNGNGYTNGSGSSGYEYGFVVEVPEPLNIDETDKSIHKTWPYSVKNGRMVILRENKDGDIDAAPIADFTATIAEEIADESGNVALVISGKGIRRGAFRTEISGSDFGSDTKLLSTLTEVTGGIDVVYPNMSKHLRPAIGMLTEDEARPRRTRYYRTGWQDSEFTRFLLPGMDANTLLSMPAQMAYSAPPADADMTQGLYALRCLIEALDPVVTTPVMAGLLMPPLLRPAGWGNERVAVFIAGRTGSLKTSWTQTAMCLYGHEFSSNDKLLKFGEGATRNAIMGFAAHAHDLPLFIDNFKPNTGNGKGDFVNLIHNILEGGDRKRSDRNGNLRESKEIHCIPIATGEDVPRDDAASLARIILVPYAWQRGESNDNLTEAQRLSRHLNAVGYAWILWIAGEGRAVIRSTAAQFPAYRSKWAETLRKIDADSANIARVASNLAVNELTWEIATQAPGIGATLQPFTAIYRRGLLDIARTMSRSTAEAMEAIQWRNAIRELLASGQYTLVDRALGQPTGGHERDRLLGWQDSDGVYLLPAIALAAVKKLLGPLSLQVSPQMLYGQMEQLGWLARQDREQTTRKVSIGGNKERVLHLLPTVLAKDENDDDETEDGEVQLRELGL